MIKNSKITRGVLMSYISGAGDFIEIRLDTKKEPFSVYAQSDLSYTVIDYRMWDRKIKTYCHMRDTIEYFETLK